MSAKPYDQAFKYLAEQDPKSLLILLGCLRPREKARIELLPRELSVSTLLPDQPYCVRTQRETWIAHVEAQTVYEYGIPERMAEYGARLWMNYRLPVRSYVLLLTNRNLPARAPAPGIIDAGDIEIRAHYHLVRLWRQSAASALAAGRESLLPFVPLMQGGKAEIEEGAAMLRRVEDDQRRRDLSLHFILLGGLRYNRDDILELVVRRGMIPLEQLKDSSMYEYIVEEGLREGRRKGLQEGREEGREEGKFEGIAEALLIVLGKRFPDMDASKEIRAIRDVAALEKLLAEAMDISDAAVFQKRIIEVTKKPRPRKRR